MPKQQRTKKATRSTKARKKVATPTRRRRDARPRLTRQPTVATTVSTSDVEEQFFEHPALGIRMRYVLDDDGDYWFVMRDAAQAMGLVSPASAARELPAHTKRTREVPTPGGPQQLLTINESGLYRLAGKTRRRGPAQQFTDWVYDVVLPTIRRTGSYSVPNRSQPAELSSSGPSEPTLTPALFVEEVRGLVTDQKRYDEQANRALLHDLFREVARQERCKPSELAIALGYPRCRGKLLANVPLSELEALKQTLRQRIIDQMTVTWRIIPRPKQKTQRTSDLSIDYSPHEVADKLALEHELGITAEELCAPMGIYDFIGLYPHSDPDAGDHTPYLDDVRYLYLSQWIKINPTSVRMIRAYFESIHAKARAELAELNVEDRRDPVTVVTTDGDTEDEDEDGQAAAE